MGIKKNKGEFSPLEIEQKEEREKFHAYITKLKIESEDLLKEIGCGLTMLDYCNYLYSEKLGYASLLYKNLNGESGQKTVAVEKVKENIVINEFVGCFSSMNTFFIPVRRSTHVNKIGFFYVDIDPRNLNMEKDKAFKLLKDEIEEGLIPEPTIIIDSGGGYYAIWKIESVPGGFKSVQKLHKRIEEFLVDKLSFIGADEKVTDLARVLRIPGTINQKYNKEVRLLEFNPKNVYTMRFFQEFMNLTNGIDWENQKKEWEENREKRNKEKEKKQASKGGKTRKGKISNLFNFYSLSVARVGDIRKFVELSNYKLDKKRNETLFIYAVELMKINKNSHIVRQKVEELNAALKDSLSDSEVKEICQSAYRHYETYNYKTETIIRKLGIKTEQQKHMKTLIGKEEKLERKNTKRKADRRNEEGLTARQQAKIDLMNQVKELKEKGLKQKEMADKLNLTSGRISQIIKELKKV